MDVLCMFYVNCKLGLLTRSAEKNLGWGFFNENLLEYCYRNQTTYFLGIT